MALLVALTLSQQICLHRECQKELDGCDTACAAQMGECTFGCTLGSLGCLEKCLDGNTPAVALLQCSFNKCINV
jgi:GR25 family glycosyltransferase involved in LPS biosynthesis